jgi:hypothetical protein
MFFATQGCVGASVEHDRMWADDVAAKLSAAPGLEWDIRWEEPEPGVGGDPADPDAYTSDESTFANRRFDRYAASIETFPDAHFDFVLVDGRSRPSCFKHSVSKVASGGWLILDNSERKHYRVVHDTLRTMGWTRHRFDGPGPYGPLFWETTMWQKP